MAEKKTKSAKSKSATPKKKKDPQQWQMPEKIESRLYKYFEEHWNNVEIRKLIRYFFGRQESKVKLIFNTFEDFEQECLCLFWRLIIRSTCVRYADLLITWKKMKNVFCKSIDRLITWSWIQRKRRVQPNMSINDKNTMEYINYSTRNIEKSKKCIADKMIYKSDSINILMNVVSSCKSAITLQGLKKKTGFSEKFIIRTVIKEFDLTVSKKDNGEYCAVEN